METNTPNSPTRNQGANGGAQGGGESNARIALAAVLIGCTVVAVTAVARNTSSAQRSQPPAAETRDPGQSVTHVDTSSYDSSYLPARFDPPTGEASGNVKTFEHE